MHFYTYILLQWFSGCRIDLENSCGHFTIFSNSFGFFQVYRSFRSLVSCSVDLKSGNFKVQEPRVEISSDLIISFVRLLYSVSLSSLVFFKYRSSFFTYRWGYLFKYTLVSGVDFPSFKRGCLSPLFTASITFCKG